MTSTSQTLLDAGLARNTDTNAIRPATRRIRLCLACVCSLLPLVSPACSSSIHRSDPSFTSGESLTASGDWNDIDAAVRVAARSAELAILSREEPRPGEVVYSLLTITDEPGSLTIAVTPPLPTNSVTIPTPGENVKLTMSAKIGRFGDQSAERELLGAVQRRLAQLKGVDVAPLD